MGGGTFPAIRHGKEYARQVAAAVTGITVGYDDPVPAGAVGDTSRFDHAELVYLANAREQF